MTEVTPEAFLKDAHIIMGWDIDGVICPTNWLEKKLENIYPGFVPKVQEFFQRSNGRFDPRQRIAHWFLRRRSLSDESVDALINSYEQKGEIMQNSNLVVKNAIYTDRPATARDLIFDQMRDRLASCRPDLEVTDLVEGYFDNPSGDDPRQLKVRAAQELESLGIKFYLIEDKVHTAVRVKQAASSTNVYLLLNTPAKEDYCKQNGINPVYSPAEFVKKAFEDIRTSQQIPAY